VKRSLLLLVSLISLTSCNYYTKSLCEGRDSLDLAQHLGSFEMISKTSDNALIVEVEFKQALGEDLYHMTFIEDGEVETAFEDAVACQVGSKTILEFIDGKEYAFYELGQSPFSLTAFAYSEKMLIQDQVPYAKTSLPFGLEGLSPIVVDNENLDDAQLLNYMVPLSKSVRR